MTSTLFAGEGLDDRRVVVRREHDNREYADRGGAEHRDAQRWPAHEERERDARTSHPTATVTMSATARELPNALVRGIGLVDQKYLDPDELGLGNSLPAQRPPRPRGTSHHRYRTSRSRSAPSGHANGLVAAAGVTRHLARAGADSVPSPSAFVVGVGGRLLRRGSKGGVKATTYTIATILITRRDA